MSDDGGYGSAQNLGHCPPRKDFLPFYMHAFCVKLHHVFQNHVFKHSMTILF